SDGIKAQVGEFVQRLDVPILQLAVGKVEVGQLDPNVLFTGREALALVARADSAQSAWNAAAGSLDVQAAGDSGVAMAGRLRNAELSFILDAAGPAARQRRYAGRLMGLTSSPRLYGRPTTLFAEAPGVRVAAALDHVRPVPRDSGMGTAQGAALPGLDLPSLP